MALYQTTKGLSSYVNRKRVILLIANTVYLRRKQLGKLFLLFFPKTMQEQFTTNQ